MAVITGGNIITGGVIMENTGPRLYRGSGAPTGGTTLDGVIVEGDLYVDVANDNVYEFTDTDTFTRIDTI